MPQDAGGHPRAFPVDDPQSAGAPGERAGLAVRLQKTERLAAPRQPPEGMMTAQDMRVQTREAAASPRKLPPRRAQERPANRVAHHLHPEVQQAGRGRPAGGAEQILRCGGRHRHRRALSRGAQGVGRRLHRAGRGGLAAVDFLAGARGGTRGSQPLRHLKHGTRAAKRSCLPQGPLK